MRAKDLIPLGLVALGACTGDVPREARVVVEVAGRPVTMGELDRFVASSVHQESPFLAGEVMAALFEDFIEEQLLLRAAEDAGVVPDPRAVSRRMEAIERAEPAAAVPRQGEEDAVYETVENQARIERFLETHVLAELSVSDAEIEAYYESYPDYFVRPETVDVSQILVGEEALARDLREQLRQRDASFEALAEAHSQGPEAANKGRLGAFTRGELPPSFEEVVFALEPGQLSDVVATDFGFHVFRLNERTETTELALEDVREVIRADLLRRKGDEAVAAYVEELRARYPVVVHREHLSFALVDWEQPGTVGEAREVER